MTSKPLQTPPYNPSRPRLPFYQTLQFRNALFLILLTLLTFVWMIPVIWTVSTSLRTELAIQRDLGRLIPEAVTFENWTFLLSKSRLPRWFFNSLGVSVIHTILQLVICSLGAYAFARLKFIGSNVLYTLVLAGLMVPFQVTFIPVYVMFSDFNWLNTYGALIIPGVASPFAVFLLTQFFKNVPMELEEAAYLDGANRFQVYWRIILPLSIPALTTLAIFAFLGNWNSYLWPLIAATKQEVMTLPIGLAKVSQSWGFVNFYGRNMAAAALSALPIVLFVFAFQRKIISGISINSGIK
ncbi:MAG: carbohydrate ABC transporter permease [Chloroflexota bacterium]